MSNERAHLATISIAALRSRVLPRWLCIAGEAAAVILLFSVLFLPMVVLPLWVVAASVVLLSRKGPAAPEALPPRAEDGRQPNVPS